MLAKRLYETCSSHTPWSLTHTRDQCWVPVKVGGLKFPVEISNFWPPKVPGAQRQTKNMANHDKLMFLWQMYTPLNSQHCHNVTIYNVYFHGCTGAMCHCCVMSTSASPWNQGRWICPKFTRRNSLTLYFPRRGSEIVWLPSCLEDSIEARISWPYFLFLLVSWESPDFRYILIHMFLNSEWCKKFWFFSSSEPCPL